LVLRPLTKELELGQVQEVLVVIRLVALGIHLLVRADSVQVALEPISTLKIYLEVLQAHDVVDQVVTGILSNNGRFWWETQLKCRPTYPSWRQQKVSLRLSLSRP
jgi:hypothetical protein